MDNFEIFDNENYLKSTFIVLENCDILWIVDSLFKNVFFDEFIKLINFGFLIIEYVKFFNLNLDNSLFYLTGGNVLIKNSQLIHVKASSYVNYLIEIQENKYFILNNFNIRFI
jgi:hypothetical protein